MDFESLRRSSEDARNVQAQRDAAESKIPTERLRRLIREAFEREDARERREAGLADVESDATDRT